MAVNLTDKINQTKVFTLDWDGDDVDVSYRPNAVTPALLEEVDEAAKADDLSMLGVLLDPVLDWWDVLDADGQRIGTDPDTIRTLPMRFIGLVQRGIERDQNPPEDGTSAGS